jgi:putative addiction module killer protein
MEPARRFGVDRLSSIDSSRNERTGNQEAGLVPFDEWFDSLRDRRMQAAVDARLTRVRAGNFGDCKSVGGGVFELRINFGPGLRVYCGLHGQEIVLLLGGGDKRSQSRDIGRAQELWQQFKKYASKKLQN